MKCFAGGPQDIVDAHVALRSTQEPVDLDLRTYAGLSGR
jgi:hypothetical protein